MNRVLLAICFLATTAASAVAGSLQDYIDKGNVELDSLKFTFDVSSYDAGNSGIEAKDITVENILAVGDVGFKFTIPGFTQAVRLKSKTMTIGFKAESMLNLPQGISEEKLVMNSFVEVGGVASIMGTSLSVSTLTGKTMDQKSFSPPVASVTVSDALKVEVGNSGSATISSFTETFLVPEPPGLVLMASGLIGLVAGGLWRSGMK
jgi:hypothetical protein